MLSIIIIGLVLIIVGIGSTILYDKYKDKIISSCKDFEFNRTWSIQYSSKSQPKKTKKSSPPKSEIDRSIKQARAEIKQIKKELEQQTKRPVKTQQVPSNLEEQLKQLFDSMNIE